MYGYVDHWFNSEYILKGIIFLLSLKSMCNILGDWASLIWHGNMYQIGIQNDINLKKRRKTPQMANPSSFAANELKKYFNGTFHLNYWVILPTHGGFEPFAELQFPKSSSVKKNWVDVVVSVTTLENKTLKDLGVYPHDTFSFTYEKQPQTLSLVVLKSHMVILQLRKLTRNVKIANIASEMETRHKYRARGHDISLKVRANTLFSFSKKHKHQIIALPGLLYHVSMALIEGRGSILNIYWVLDNYADYDYFLKEDPEKCNDHFVFSYPLCFNYSNVGPTKSEHYYVFFWNVYRLYDRKDRRRKALKSWLEANKLCTSINGYLPILRNKDELNELIALLRLSKLIPPVEYLYIGLRQEIKTGNKVGNNRLSL